MAIFKLGLYQFVNCHNAQNPAGPPPILQEMTETIQRPGVDGTGVFKLGLKAEPFQMRSCVDLIDTTIDIVFNGYRDMVAEAKYTLIWADVDWFTTFGVQFVVLHVEIYSIRKVLVKAGGITAGANRWLEAIWTLQPVAGG